MNYRNPIRSSVNTIDCEIDHPIYGWIPFTAAPYDSVQYGRDIFATEDAKLPAWVEPPPDLNQLASEARAKRNNLLTASDWTQVPDAPVDNKELWKTYRQALRDITAQSGFPEIITWPIQP